MLTNAFLGDNVSRLGFGTMRLPCRADGSVDEARVMEMTEYGLAHGVNYVDTAVPYHGGMSETVMGSVLSRFDRGSFFLADKYPGHQHLKEHHPRELFEGQLKKLRTDYFDFYLLHNVCENSWPTYGDRSLRLTETFLEEKAKGRIRHLGLSSHSSLEHLRFVLDTFGSDIEFVQIQANYADWTLQQAKEKYELLTERNIPVIVMESVRGGALANLSEAHMARLEAFRPGMSAASWAFRFLQGYPNFKVALSGMSDLAQMKDNVAAYEMEQPLTKEETETLFSIAAEIMNCVPCTRCRYCTAGCPQGLDIPALIAAYNDVKVNPKAFTSPMFLQSLPADKSPEACLRCGACRQICPQGIDIPAILADLSEIKKTLPDWAKICEERNRLAAGK